MRGGTVIAALALGQFLPVVACAQQSQAPLAATGIDQRIPWTTSRVVGSPDPPLPLRAVRAFPQLSFDHPLYIIGEPAPRPGTDLSRSQAAAQRLFVVEQKGKILAFPNDPAVNKTDVFLALSDRDTYGMTFHPGYAENRHVYVFSNGTNSKEKDKLNRISRFTVSREPPRACDLASEKIIIEWESNGHNGGDLAFGPDGMLYASAGDGTSDSDTNITGQKISDLVSGMLRIDVDHPAPGKEYSVPKDNPFLDLADARPELWAYGFRNPWRIHFDPQGNLWCGDIGQDQWEMVEIVRRGDNYGWSVMEGGHPFYLERQRGPHPIVTPAIVHPHSEARSITGGVTYLGKKFPEFAGAYIYGDYGTGKIWAARYDGKKVASVKEIADTPYQILGFGIDATGELYFVDYAGPLYTLERRSDEKPLPPFPTRLSETGLFKSVAGHVVEPALIPYSVNSPLWSDHAHKERFIALPGMSQIEFSEDEAWKFPEATVLVKTFSLDLEPGRAASRKRIETRLLVFQQNEWVGYTYLWNDEQTDAVLVDAGGADKTFTIREPQGPREQVWHYPSRAECMVCHSRAAVYVLGLNTRQMNRIHDYGGRRAHQLRTLEHLGVFLNKDVPPAEAAAGRAKPWHFPKPVEQYPALADPGDTSAGLEDRVRSYLHANCAQCHVAAGGGNAAMELGILTAREKTKLVGVPPLHDRFGITDPLLVAPGAPERSVLLHRMSIRGRGQMPPLASSLVDEAGNRLLREWIERLP
ncbi:MAG: PQQ-dependent sugar dehydrogenase [Planctomycetia bacterium]|nr:PQQ-dependent sugar dehydrogenase [Planctomycetia bacterium]